VSRSREQIALRLLDVQDGIKALDVQLNLVEKGMIAEEDLNLRAVLEAVMSDSSASLSELVYSLLDELAARLLDLEQAAHLAGDPVTEYRRLLRAAEAAITRSPEAGRALAEVADRWLSDALISAHRGGE
jgi:hypothetical protein